MATEWEVTCSRGGDETNTTKKDTKQTTQKVSCQIRHTHACRFYVDMFDTVMAHIARACTLCSLVTGRPFRHSVPRQRQEPSRLSECALLASGGGQLMNNEPPALDVAPQGLVCVSKVFVCFFICLAVYCSNLGGS